MSSLTHSWIPFPLRSKAHQALGEMRDRYRCKTRRAPGKLPERCLAADVERCATGGDLLWRCFQQIGSCVGAGASKAYYSTMASDNVRRGDQGKIPMIFPFATWGWGRQIAQMGGRGGGSSGSAQAQAVSEMGILLADFPGLPRPTIKSWNGKTVWIWWSGATETEWSWPRQWPLPIEQVKANMQAHQCTKIHNIETTEDVVASCIEGDWPTIASDFGCDRPQIKEGYLIATRDTSWSHQMSIGGFVVHPTLGLLFEIDNQWSPEAGPYRNPCPFLSSIGVDGSFWITEKTLAEILKGRWTECWTHSNIEQDELAPLDWSGVLSTAA